METPFVKVCTTTRVIRTLCFCFFAALALVGFTQAPFGTFSKSATPASAAGVELAWKACGPVFQCATLPVPLDYRKPDGKKIAIALIKLPATDTKNRIGSLVVNPGGPGGSGVNFVAGVGETLFANLRTKFDIIGFDPRGTGFSSPVNCRTAKERDAVGAAPKAYTTIGEDITSSKEFVALCAQRNSTTDLLPFLSTKNTAMDMDHIRIAVGDEKLTYLGTSYGTYLGATYASLFPNNVRALVLDGAINPSTYANTPFAVDEQQAASYEKGLKYFFSYCETTPKECKFGDGNPASAFDRLVSQLDKQPIKSIKSNDPRPVNGTTALSAAFVSLYVRSFWPTLAEGLYQADVNKDGSILRVLDDTINGRHPDGTYDPGDGAFSGIRCGDQSYPQDLRAHIDFAKRLREISPHFGSVVETFNCALWPVQADERFTGPFSYEGKGVPILVVGTTYDPATPYQGAIDLTADLRNARLLTMDGYGHAAYGNGSPSCIDAKVDSYLISLAVPESGTVCKQVIEAPQQPQDAGSANSPLKDMPAVKQ